MKQNKALWWGLLPLATLGLLLWALRSGRAPDPAQADLEQGFREFVEAQTKSLFRDFEASAKGAAPRVGEGFPPIRLTTTDGEAVVLDGKISVLVFGPAKCRSCSELFFRLREFTASGEGQVLLVVTNGELPLEVLSGIRVVDARSDDHSSTGKMREAIGLTKVPVAYLIAQDRTVWFRSSAAGFQNDLPVSLKRLQDGQPLVVDERLEELAPGKPLDTAAAGEHSDELAKVMASPTGLAVIVFSDRDCVVCGGLAEDVQRDLEQLVGQGFGAAVVERGSSTPATEKNGVWRLPDPDGKLSQAWRINRWPHAILAREGRYAGEVGYADARGESENKDGGKVTIPLTRAPFTGAVGKALQSLNKPNQ